MGIGAVSALKCATGCSLSSAGVVTGSTAYDSTTCPNAGAQAVAKGLITIASDLQMENDGGSGSACGHLEETLLQGTDWSDVMTYRFDANKDQLLTTVDLGALEDLGGYSGIEYENADTIPNRRRAQSLDPPGLPPLRPTTSFILRHAGDDGWVAIENI